jgi:hypothetical protein
MLDRAKLKAASVPLVASLAVLGSGQSFDVKSTYFRAKMFVPSSESIARIIRDQTPSMTEVQVKAEVKSLQSQFDQYGSTYTNTFAIHRAEHATEVWVTSSAGQKLDSEGWYFDKEAIYEAEPRSAQTGIIRDLREASSQHLLGLHDPIVASRVFATNEIDDWFSQSRPEQDPSELRVSGQGASLVAEVIPKVGTESKLTARYIVVRKSNTEALLRKEFYLPSGQKDSFYAVIEVRRASSQRSPKIPFQKGKYVADRRGVPDGLAPKMIVWQGEAEPYKSPWITPEQFRNIAGASFVLLGLAAFGIGRAKKKSRNELSSYK